MSGSYGMWRIWILAAVLSALTALPLWGGEPASEVASASGKQYLDPPAETSASCGSSYVSAARRMRAVESAKSKSTSPFAGIFGF